MGTQQNYTREQAVEMLEAEASKKGLSANAVSVLKRIMNVESNGNKSAVNANSSAKGLFQFIDSTWASYVKKYPSELTMDGRFDPKQQIIAAIYLTQDNEKTLSSSLNKPPNAGEIYLAHFLGAGGGGAKHGSEGIGAIDTINMAATKPETPVQGFIWSKAIESNKKVALPLQDNSKLTFENFTVADAVNWANNKMGEPMKYDTSKYKRDEKGGVESIGTMVMVAIVAVVGLVVAALSGGGDDDIRPPRTPNDNRRQTSRA